MVLCDGGRRLLGYQLRQWRGFMRADVSPNMLARQALRAVHTGGLWQLFVRLERGLVKVVHAICLGGHHQRQPLNQRGAHMVSELQGICTRAALSTIDHHNDLLFAGLPNAQPARRTAQRWCNEEGVS